MEVLCRKTAGFAYEGVQSGGVKTCVKGQKWFRMSALMYRVCLVMILVLGCAGSVAAKDWRGILPMHSTRADVERVLGPAHEPSNRGTNVVAVNNAWAIYYLDEAEVRILYSQQSGTQGKCPPAVPDGTVMMIQVMPNAGQPVKDLNLQKGFRKFNPTSDKESLYEGFINEEDGFVVRTNKGTVDLMVYLASANDRPRCPDYYGTNTELFVAVGMRCGLGSKFDEYGDQPFEDEKARLDNLAIQISLDPELKGHVIVYAGQKATVAQAQIHANRIKNYLVSVRELDPKRVSVVDGGYREDFTVQLYVIPSVVGPPEPTPTVEAKDVELVYEKPKRRGRKNR